LIIYGIVVKGRMKTLEKSLINCDILS